MAKNTMPTNGRNCKICGLTYLSSIVSKATCSPECAKEADRIRSREYQRGRRKDLEPADLPWRSCRVCGAPYQQTGPRHLSCSRACSRSHIAAVRPSRAALVLDARNCLCCGDEFQPRTYQNNYCSARCKSLSKLQNAKASRTPKRDAALVKQCQECGGDFSPRDTRQYLCSVSCNAKVQGRIGSRTRRARIAGVPSERVDPILVFERDGWRCHICGVKTLKAKRGSIHPRAPELDHIIPIARGGEHSYRNTACSCSTCNRSKGAKLIGQMLLFG